MKKRELLERIEQLEQKVATIERHADVAADRFLELDLLLRGMLDPTREAFERDYPLPTTQHNEKDPDLFRQRVERVEGLMEGAFAKGRQCGGNVLARLAAEAGQPSMTVTATDEKDADLAKAATQALRFAEGDMAGKLREFLGPMAPDYMRQIDVPLPTFCQEASQVLATVEAPPKPAYEAEVERREKEAGKDVAGVHEAPAPRAPILLYPHSLEGFHVGTGTAHQIDKLARAGSLESDAALMDFLHYVVEKVMWCGKVGKIDGLEGVFKYEMDGDVFKVDYQGADLGNYSLMDGWWLKRIA